MSARELRAFFEAHREDAGGLVLATVYETLGATYSKAGAQMLISGSGQFQGMLSGGCLEGDLAERARQVIGSGDAQRVTYDLREDDESLWGLGVGCEGLMRIFLQPLRAVDAFAPFPAMLEILAGDETGAALTIVASDDPEVMPGASLTGTVWPPQAAGALPAVFETARDGQRSSLQTLRRGDATLELLAAVLNPPPNILVLGAGLDAEPVVRLCADLGWRVTVQDHRPAYIDKGNFSGAQEIVCVPAETLAETLRLQRNAVHEH